MKFKNTTPDRQKFDTWDLSSGEMYLHFRDVRDNDPETWHQHLTKLVKSRIMPSDAEYQNGYYVVRERYPDNNRVEYRINEHGCRSRNFSEIKNRPVIVGIGCSITHGTGLIPAETWIHKLAELLDCEYVNLGMPGSALTISSLYLSEVVLPLFRNVMGVFVYTPPPNRVDLITYTDLDEAQYSISDQEVAVRSLINIIENNGYNKTDAELLKAIEHTAFIQQEKDLLLLKLTCDTADIPFHAIDNELFWRSARVESNRHTYTKARDGDHDGAELHTDIAKAFADRYNPINNQ